MTQQFKPDDIEAAYELFADQRDGVLGSARGLEPARSGRVLMPVDPRPMRMAAALEGNHGDA